MIRAFCDACGCELESSPYTSKHLVQVKWTEEKGGTEKSKALDFCWECKTTFLAEINMPVNFDFRKKLK